MYATFPNNFPIRLCCSFFFGEAWYLNRQVFSKHLSSLDKPITYSKIIVECVKSDNIFINKTLFLDLIFKKFMNKGNKKSHTSTYYIFS